MEQTCASPARQVPVPVQKLFAVATPDSQVAGAQFVSVSGKEQSALLPSQRPPQAPSPVQGTWNCTGAPVTNEHVPTLPGCTQDAQLPSQAVSQQTPSTQKPELHSSLVVHLCPCGSSGTHWCASQRKPFPQPASDWHMSGHEEDVPSQR